MKNLQSFKAFSINEGTYDDTMKVYGKQIIDICAKVNDIQKFIFNASEEEVMPVYNELEKQIEKGNLAWAESLGRRMDSPRECGFEDLMRDLISLSNQGEEIGAQVNYGEDFVNDIHRLIKTAPMMEGSNSLLKDATKAVELLNKKDKGAEEAVEEFVNNFSQAKGSACEVWMDYETMKKLTKAFAKNDSVFKCKAFDGNGKEEKAKMVAKGWKVFASDQNIQQSDFIFIKNK